VTNGIGDDITRDEAALLIGGLSDDIAFVWALIHLRLRRNDGTDGVPTDELVDAAFAHFDRLLERGLIRIGRVVYADANQPAGTVAPVKHVSEPVDEVRRRVMAACARAAAGQSDWEWACWIVNTPAGDNVARHVLERP
jgi:hypothetical protein